jgi:hypothetical protein
MQSRFHHRKLLAAVLLMPLLAYALDLSNVTQQEAGSGLKETLTRASSTAVAKLGTTDGFLNNANVHIPLPDGLKKAEKAMKLLGKQKQFEELEVSINRAAEAAMPEAKTLLINAVKSMSVSDAKQILSGGDDAVTQFFKGKTETQLSQKFLPIVKKATDKVGLAQQYNQLADQAASFGVVKKEDSKIENYVTRKALDGLFLTLAEEERAIRNDPIGTGSALLKKIFGGG